MTAIYENGPEAAKADAERHETAKRTRAAAESCVEKNTGMKSWRDV